MKRAQTFKWKPVKNPDTQEIAYGYLFVIKDGKTIGHHINAQTKKEAIKIFNKEIGIANNENDKPYLLTGVEK